MTAPKAVLVVEDEAMVAMLIEDTLTDNGFTVVGPAAGVRDAMEFVASSRIDAAVLDLNLGGESSAAVADELARRNIPFLICSGYGAAGVPERHRDRPTLSKPYDPRDLLRLVRDLTAKD
jgi:DNA-binding response OmpR family regulator